ncbi:glycosyltransferase family 4 protein [Rhizobium sp. SSA_523]|uniref:glycosyltransferase family 4 protein n=1 Tax=Rhizobium sp. SSA_523 TaxID=2952477 RepID=UPI002091640F|nr:glycosyltransferase family 4 protein [Rhizobium sp. SSA_523]MCO5732351.1 glycosyltransferase family 4 protein [Rhizobium sp. SSA_523]WKC21251.1 glycosyltransferase family 4 protein [Rhizobium sp. SSA_523]
MKIAFYAPLKSPEHSVPSGDRLMARQLLAALGLAGHQVEVVSHLRAFSPSPDVPAEQEVAAKEERARISAMWRQTGAPDLWFSYHPYYKAPDRLGPILSRQAGIPYVTAESSYSRRRDIGGWALSQKAIVEGIRQAAVNICLTDRDRAGLYEAVPEARLERLQPFIDVAPFRLLTPRPRAGRLAVVAMMRPGDKLSSYRCLAAVLAGLLDEAWTLDVVGDGPARSEVADAFSAIPPERLVWHGELPAEAVRAVLSSASLYLWPGHGEAYGLSYLEAQAAGLPTIAENVAGVSEVVSDGRSGILVPGGDLASYRRAIRQLLQEDERRGRMSLAARRFVLEERSLEAASQRLDAILRDVSGAA